MSKGRFGEDARYRGLERRAAELEDAYKKRYGLRPAKQAGMQVLLGERERRALRRRVRSAPWASSDDLLWLGVHRDGAMPYRDFWDHPSCFRDGAGGPVFVCQPYFEDDAAIARVEARAREFAAANGLAVRVSREESWWYPGLTVLIEYRRAAR